MNFPFYNWTPKNFGNLQLWLEAARGITIGTGVAQWDDLSGNARNAMQANGANQPELVLNQVNGFPVLRFNGSTSFMDNPLTLAEAFNQNGTDITIAAVFKSTNSNPNENPLISTPLDDPANSALSLFVPYSPDGDTYFDSGNEGGSRVNGILDWDDYAVGVFTRTDGIAFNPARVYKNNAFALGGTPSGTFANGGLSLMIGAYSVASVLEGLLTGDIAELAIWNRGLTEEEVCILSQIWGAKYNIIQA